MEDEPIANGTLTTAVFEYGDRTETHTVAWHGGAWHTRGSSAPMELAHRVTLADGTRLASSRFEAQTVLGDLANV